ncbi:scavenger receptor class F member 1 [Takifugu flavidus]|uniref:scavenger receptor class F member 1 n=1 Tax=Takifugu flavidus TaxID=433684 RepID=UPI0025441F31|nr:scavenger receptor class F member 1 [Takifugu flavidus]
MRLILGALSALLCCSLSYSNTLDPAGKNVCRGIRDPSMLVCCTGWRQEGKECSQPVCEGKQACLKEEICVDPGLCRCPAGYFGAQCRTRCPPEFWAPDCRQVCRCHPHGRCHPVTGECTCNPNRWGPLCQNSCRCTRHGRCHQGNCTCDEGWWNPTCSKPCQCVSGGSLGLGCDQLTGRCQCQKGHWGPKCLVSCKCHRSPCNQRTGVCECEAGWWGPSCGTQCDCDPRHSSCDPNNGLCLCHPGYKGLFCNQVCEAGTYGSGCSASCGSCKGGHFCSTTDGACDGCEPGWNGIRCDRPCPSGYYGDGCRHKCPRCRSNEPCEPVSGKCEQCYPGWSGPRCEKPCTNRTFGDACSFLCGPCFHGNCNHVTGRCVCQPGFWGESCNSSCPVLHFGLNCSSSCDCGEGIHCNPVTGACPSRGSVVAAVLVPLFLLLLAVLCCCLCCGGRPVEAKERAAVADGDLLVRMKYHVYSVLANIGAALPCISDWSSGLPRVTVSHHDPELTFNHSFIEPPSSGWVTEGSSFDSDGEEGEVLYCVPPREDIEAVAGGEFQEMSSKCNMFLDPSGFSSEDISSPFNIPRTSSIAKSKRPSVSFAEGTRFSPKERRGSTQEPGGLRRGLMMSALQNQGDVARTGEEDEMDENEREDGMDGKAPESHEACCKPVDQEEPRATSQGRRGPERRRTNSNTAAPKGTQVSTSEAAAGTSDKVTTVYMTVGKAGPKGWKTELNTEGPVQAMLRRLGSLQRQREQQDSGRHRPKAVDGVTKPPRKKLGARASVWEQGGPSGTEVSICKPIRRKQAMLGSAEAPAGTERPSSDNGTPKRPLSSILKSVPEVAPAEAGSNSQTDGEAIQGGESASGRVESSYLTIGPVGGAGKITEIIANEGAEPCYENVMIQHS